MRTADGFYWIPILPRELADLIKDRPRSNWPTEIEAEYRRLHAEFTASKAEFIEWLRKDRDSRMNKTAKLITSFMIDRLNFDTGRCDPSHQFIADELFLSLRTVERTIPRIAASGWIDVTRRGKTTTNFYRFRVAVAKVNALLDLTMDLKDRRLEARARRLRWSDPTKVADHSAGDPTKVADHEPTNMAGHEPTEMTGKPLNRTFEEEPLNEGIGSEGEGYTQGATTSYAHASGKDDRFIPFAPPADEDDASEMIMGWLEGQAPHVVISLFDDISDRLATGTFTPAELEAMLRRAA